MHALLYLCGLLIRIKRESHGAVAAEYAFLIVFIAIAAAVGMVAVGETLANYFITFGNALLSAGNAMDTSSAS